MVKILYTGGLLCLFFQLHTQRLDFGSLKWAFAGVLIPQTRSHSASLHAHSNTSSLTWFSLSGLSVDPSLGMTQAPWRRSRNSLSKSFFLWAHTFPGAEAKGTVMAYRAFIIPIFWSVDYKWDAKEAKVLVLSTRQIKSVFLVNNLSRGSKQA